MLLTFVRKALVFCAIPLSLMLGVALLVPPTPRAATSLLFAELDKAARLDTAPPRRLILVGGSNLSFGINSQKLEDAFQVYPVNMGLHASLGLKYMMDSVVPAIQPGDTVVLAPEYAQFFGERAYGGAELLRLVLDVDRRRLQQLNLKQWLNILPELPKFSLSKLKTEEYFFQPSEQVGVYERASFNAYGDAVAHWGLPPEPFAPYQPASDPWNSAVITDIHTFEQQVRERGGALYISFPGLQDASFDNLHDQIDAVEHALRAGGFQILGDPERYKIPDHLMFNTPYHLTEEGANWRTRLLIEDLSTTAFVHPALGATP